METSWHTFITCPYARECWANAKLNHVVEAQAEGAEGFTQWLFKIIQDLSGAELRKFATILWAIWKQRNYALWNNHVDTPNRVVVTAMSFLYDWMSLARSNKEVHDALCFFDDIKSAGISMVVRNDEVLFEVDALTVYNAMTESAAEITEFGGIMGRCRDILATNPGFSVHFTRRQAKEIPHVLAKHSRFYASPCVWLETPMCIGALMDLYLYQYVIE
ncbi:uncharacterized protein [Primulina eburnea]|uniref:uncharacterized protein n=1 Tax=Primulina eburnea TaxID=1245227 RepID=UPI003C6BF3CC